MEDKWHQLFNIDLELHDSFRNFYTKARENFDIGSVDVDQLVTWRRQSEWEFVNKKSKIMRKEKLCIVFGDNSAGKSSTINALLKRNDLPTGYLTTTSAISVIRKSPTNETYFSVKEYRKNNTKTPEPETNPFYGNLFDHSIDNSGSSSSVNGEEKKSLSELANVMKQDIINLKSEKEVSNRFYYEVFYDENTCPFLTEEMVIIDTPGTFTSKDMDKNIEEYCDDADMVMFVSSSIQSVNINMIAFMKQFCPTLRDTNFYVVFNWWDIPDKKPDRDTTKANLMEEIKNIFKTKFQKSINLTDERIFFICAEEEVLINAKDETVETVPRWKERHENFLHFEKRMKEQLNVNSFKRRCEYLEGLYFVVKSDLQKYQNLINKINKKITLLSQNFVNDIINLDNVEEKLKKEVSDIFGPLSEVFLKEAAEKVTQDISREDIVEFLRIQRGNNNENITETQIEEFRSTIHPDDKSIIIINLISKMICDSFERLQLKLIDILKERDDANLSQRIMILVKILFPSFKDACIIVPDQRVTTDLTHIAKVKRYIKWTANISTAVLTGGGLATGGIGLAFLETLAKRAVVGAALSTITGMTIGIGKNFTDPSTWFCQESLKNVKDKWKELENNLCSTFKTILVDVDSSIRNIYTPLETHVEEIKLKLENWKSEDGYI